MSNQDTQKENEVDTIELGLWLMGMMDDWSPNESELYEYIAEQLKEKFVITDKPKAEDCGDCDCGHDNNSDN